MSRSKAQRALSLDMRVGEGLTLGDVVGEDPEDNDDAEAFARASRRDHFRAIDAFAKAELTKRLFECSRRETERLRIAAEASRRIAADLEATLVATARAGVLVGLSPAQLRIVQAQATLAANGERVTHHAAARLLGLGPKGHANVSTQVRRIAKKLASAEGEDLSTPAA